jgi:serine protease AprX
MRFYSIFLFLICLLNNQLAFTQSNEKYYYRLYFTDKNNSTFSVHRPEEFLSKRAIERRAKQAIAIDSSDLPVNAHYIEQVLTAADVRLRYVLKWENAISVELNDTSTLADLRKLSCVKQIEYISKSSAYKRANNKLQVNYTVADYGEAANQNTMINVQYLHNKNFEGQDIHIAVHDAGFIGLDTMQAYENLFAEKRILGTRNFVNDTQSVYLKSTHGMVVMSCMASKLPGKSIGTAPKAKYYLFLTEDVSSESRLEEENWVAAAEYGDSLGIDIINSSLGYTTFDDSTENYTYADLDGNTTLITRGANKAATKGILVINSAGNYGAAPWRYIGAPADGDSVLAVGAVDKDRKIAAFSSRGPSYTGKLKPNVSAQGEGAFVTYLDGEVYPINGTSFSSPIIAGAAASLWSAFPEAKAYQIRNAIEKSAHLYQSPNNDFGYGIPNFSRAFTLLLRDNNYPLAGYSMRVYPNPFTQFFKVELITPKPELGVHFQLYNVQGKLVREYMLSKKSVYSDFTFWMEDMQSGIYFLRMQHANEVEIQKLIKF